MKPALSNVADDTAYHIIESQTSENIESKEEVANEETVGQKKDDENERLEEEEEFKVRPYGEDVWFEWAWYYSSSDSTLVVIEGIFGDGDEAVHSLNVTKYSLTCAEEFLPGYERMIEMSKRESAEDIATK